VNTIADLVLVGWIPLALLVFAFLPARRAGLVVMAVGWMFVPIHSISTPGLPDLTKSMCISIAVAAGVLCFDRRRLSALRLHWLDLVTLTWLMAPSLASMANHLGAYDALSALLQRSITWGVPYVFGRLYLTSNAALRDCLWVLFLSGLVYAPLALYEVRMSPQLHRIVYGAAQHNFLQTIRGGGYRPMVFMHHGLELSMWLSWSAIAGLSLWRLLGVRRVLGIPVALPCIALLGTVLLCKSSGALALLGLTIVLMAPRTSRLLRVLVLAGVPAFLLVRAFSDGVVEDTLVSWISLWSEQRAESVAYRFDNEALLLDNVHRSPLFGLGGWSFLDVVDPWTGRTSQAVPDSYWILALSTTGVVGLISFVLALWLPAWRGMTARRPSRAVLACSLLVGMSMLDLMFNAFVTPLLVTMAGGLLFLPRGQVEAQRTPAARGARRIRATATRGMLRPRSA